jgi:hypothetical protein
MKAVISCDDVFDALTRGPFPSGSRDDEFVDLHLRACHDCRQLAEALRPAVGLFHETISEDCASALPSYRGALSNVLLTEVPMPVVVLGEQKSAPKPRSQVTAGTVALAMTGLLALFLLVTNSLADRSGNRGPDDRSISALAVNPGQKVPRPALAAFGIPLSCIPARVASIELKKVQAADLQLTPAQRDDFVCCTRCHFSGGQSVPSHAAMQKVTLACASCHRQSTSDA